MRLLHASLHRVNHRRAQLSAEPYAARGVGGISQQRRPLSAEGLLLGLVDGKCDSERDVEKTAQARVGADERQTPACGSHPLAGTMEHTQQIRVRGLASSEVDHDLRVAETKREIHTTQDASYSSCSAQRAKTAVPAWCAPSSRTSIT